MTSVAVAPAVAWTPPGTTAGTPVAVGPLDSSTLDLSRPRLFATTDEIARAKARLASEPAAQVIRDQVVAECDTAIDAKLEPIDESWWNAAKDKPWQQTYPDVYLNTGILPGKYAHPAASLAFAWHLTGQERYAQRAIELVMQLADYSFAPEHYDVGMNYTGWGVSVLKAYDLLGNRFDAGQRAKLDAFMTRLGTAVARNDAFWIANDIGGGINNHLAWHKQMLGLLGLFYNRPDLVDHCMTGPRGMASLLGDGLVDDGLWCESSLTYQFTAVAPMLLIADVQQRIGYHPGIHEITAANGRTLKQSFDAMFNVLAPDCLIPPVGDAYGARTKLWKVPSYEYAWKLWREPRYAWLVRQNPSPSAQLLLAEPLPANAAAPPIASTLFPEHGYAFMRSHRDGEYWNNPDARCAFLTYDRSNVHANADKLSIMLFGLGRMLVADVEGRNVTGPHAFSSRIQGELNRGGLSQNTVMIDGADQRCAGEMLDLMEYRDVPEDRRVTAADRRGILYPGVRQMRTLAMTPDYILDVFQVDCGNEPRQIDWIVHVLDATAAEPSDGNPLVADAAPFALPTTGAYAWLRAPRSTPLSAGRPISLDWQSGKDRLGLRILNSGFERVICCGYPATDTPDSGSIPMTIVRARTSRVVFAAVWLIGDRTRDVKFEQLPDHEHKLVYSLTANNVTREHHIPRLQ
jgi:hypothetical protein